MRWEGRPIAFAIAEQLAGAPTEVDFMQDRSQRFLPRGGCACDMSRPFEHLVAPVEVGGRTAKNRMFLAPMERNFANADWTVSERTISHYARIAAGGVGWLDIEATFVDPVGGRVRTNWEYMRLRRSMGLRA